MIWELIHTSAPRGLKPGTRGFTTVAQTKGMPAWLSEALGRMSAYRSVSDPSSAGASPIVYRHARLVRGSESYSVLSRISPCADDYSGRTNRLAHHLVLDGSAQNAVSAGPAWLLSREDLFCREWNKEPQILGPRSGFPDVGLQPQPCRRWERAAGDAGWAGEVLRRAFERSARGLYVRYLREHNILELLTEASALLPPQLRWKMTFQAGSLDDPPAELTCALRCVPTITGVGPAIRGMVPHNTIDLAAPPALVDSGYVQKARRGMPIEVTSPGAAPTTGNVVTGLSTSGRSNRAGTRIGEPEGDDSTYDLAPFGDLAADAEVRSTRPPRLAHSSEFEAEDVRKRVVTSGLAGVVVGLIIGIPMGVTFFSASQTTDIQQPSEVLTESIGDEKETAAPPEKRDEPSEERQTRRSPKSVARDKGRHGDESETRATRQANASVGQPAPEQASSGVVPEANNAAKPTPTGRSIYSPPPVVQAQWTKSPISDADVHEFEFDPAVFAIDGFVHLPKEWLADKPLQVAWLAARDGSMAEVPAWKFDGSAIVEHFTNTMADAQDSEPPSPAIDVGAEIDPGTNELRVSFHKLNDDEPFAKVAGFCIRHSSGKPPRASILLWDDSSLERVVLKRGRKRDEDEDNDVYGPVGVDKVPWITGRNDHWTYTQQDTLTRVARFDRATSYRQPLRASFENKHDNLTVRVTIDPEFVAGEVGELEPPFLVALHAALQPSIDNDQQRPSVILPNLYGVPMLEIVFPKPKKKKPFGESDSKDPQGGGS